MHKSSIAGLEEQYSRKKYNGQRLPIPYFVRFFLSIVILIFSPFFVMLAQAGNFSQPDTPKNTAKQVRALTASQVTNISGQYLHLGKNVSQGGYFYQKYWANDTETKLLSTDQKQRFLAWLSSERGFDDKKLKRCKPGTHVGFQLSYNKQTQRKPRRVVLDLKCLSITVLDINKNINEGSRSYFDPSKASLFELLNTLFPNVKR